MSERGRISSLDALFRILVLVLLDQSIPIELSLFFDILDDLARFSLLKEL